MKNNLKQLKTLFVLLFVVFYSCEKDLYDEAFKEENKNITVKHISFKDLNSNVKSKITSKINEVKKLNNSTGKFEYNAELDMYIDTDLGTLVNNNGKLYYTFPMYRESEENLENIIFAPDESGEFETFVAKYNIKPEEFNELTLDEKETLIPQLQKVYYNSLQYICIDYIYTVTNYPNCDQPGIPHENGQICSPQIVTYTATFCNWTDMGGGDSGSGGGGSTGGSSGGSGGSGGTGGTVDDGIGTTTGSGGVSTSPVGISPKDLLIKEFKKHLFNTGNTTCFNNLTEDKKEKILNFLNPLLEEDCNGNPYTNEQQFVFLENLLANLCAGGQTAQDAWNAFENQFLVPNEGKDYYYDEAYWENPSLSFPQQNLPSFANFSNAFPTIGGQQLAELVGGQVITLYTQYPSIVRGFCALKVSRALNYSGITIPNIVTTNDNPGTVLGSDGKYYFLNAKSLNKWMQKTFGTGAANPNHLGINGCDGGPNGINFINLTSNKKGIYSMVSYNSNWASGHADLIVNSVCNDGCHFQDNPPAPIDYIDIWILN